MKKTPGIRIHYTLDGSDPTSASPSYTDPFEIEETTTVRAAIFKQGQPTSVITEATIEKS